MLGYGGKSCLTKQLLLILIKHILSNVSADCGPHISGTPSHLCLLYILPHCQGGEFPHAGSVVPWGSRLLMAMWCCRRVPPCGQWLREVGSPDHIISTQLSSSLQFSPELWPVPLSHGAAILLVGFIDLPTIVKVVLSRILEQSAQSWGSCMSSVNNLLSGPEPRLLNPLCWLVQAVLTLVCGDHLLDSPTVKLHNHCSPTSMHSILLAAGAYGSAGSWMHLSKLLHGQPRLQKRVCTTAPVLTKECREETHLFLLHRLQPAYNCELPQGSA